MNRFFSFRAIIFDIDFKEGFVVHFRFLDQSADGEKDSEAENIYDSSSDLEEGTNDESSTTDSSSVSDWIEPSMQLCCPNKSGMLQQKQGFGVVLEALYMMQHEPMVKVRPLIFLQCLFCPSIIFFFCCFCL